MVAIMGISVVTLCAMIAWISIFIYIIKFSSALYFLVNLHKLMESADPNDIEDPEVDLIMIEAMWHVKTCLLIDQLLIDLTIWVLILVAIKYAGHLLLLPWLIIRGVFFIGTSLILFRAACNSLLGREVLFQNASELLSHATKTAGYAVVWYTVFLLYQQYKRANSVSPTWW